MTTSHLPAPGQPCLTCPGGLVIEDGMCADCNAAADEWMGTEESLPVEPEDGWDCTNPKHVRAQIVLVEEGDLSPADFEPEEIADMTAALAGQADWLARAEAVGLSAAAFEMAV